MTVQWDVARLITLVLAHFKVTKRQMMSKVLVSLVKLGNFFLVWYYYGSKYINENNTKNFYLLSRGGGLFV